MRSAWVPWSLCDASCLPAADSLGAVPRLRQVWRYVATAAVLLAALVTAVVLGRRVRPGVVRRFARWLLAALGVRLAVAGVERLGAGVGTLVVANHVSWLDVIALLAVEPVGMLAKQETRDWPLVGTIADRIGTAYLDRERLRTLPRTVAALAAQLRNGRSVVVFPEATTWCGTSSGRFRPAMFQAAVDAGAPVRPVTVRYRLADGRPTTVAAFVADDALVRSLARITAVGGLTVEVTPHPVLPATGSSRRDLASAAQALAIPTPQPAPVT